MYSQKFVLSIIHDGHPVKESGNNSNRQVAIPFGSEYKIRLKNKNERSCTARITIDDTPVSRFGDIIVNSGGTVDLERFITGSMQNGKKFKFVSLDHPDVDDPTKSENGIIRVEFRLAIASNGIRITPTPIKNPLNDGLNNTWWYYETGHPFVPWEGNTGDKCAPFTYTSYTYTSSMNSKSSKGIGGTSLRNSSCNMVSEPGATIEGGKSNQSFSYADLTVESFPTAVLSLKLMGINKEVAHITSRYCTNCGVEARKNDKFCGNCGKRI